MSNRRISILVFSLFIFSAPASFAKDPALPPNWQVYFSPEGGCTQAITDAIDQAKTSVFVQLYSFTSRSIERSLVSAHSRGIDVEVIADEEDISHDPHTLVPLLAKAGVPVMVDGVHAVAHNKVMIIDNEKVITGSFNFTYAAEKHNAENLLVIDDPALAALYAQNWRSHWGHSQPMKN